MGIHFMLIQRDNHTKASIDEIGHSIDHVGGDPFGPALLFFKQIVVRRSCSLELSCTVPFFSRGL